jgi:deoxyribodipyrimidine photo-lyase
MIATRRLQFNFALDRALEHCAALAKPLVIFEPLRIGYPWASDRCTASSSMAWRISRVSVGHKGK